MKPPARAFTLIELLVVLAIIAVLISLSFLAVGRAKGLAHRVQCLNNNHQLLVASAVYSDEHEDYLLPNFDDIDRDGNPTNWIAGDMWFPEDRTNASILVNSDLSAISQYIKTSATFKCPADRGPNVRSVSLNCWLNPKRISAVPSWIGGAGTNFEAYVKVHAIRNPSAIISFVDERPDSINDAYFAIDLSNTGSPDGHGTAKPFYMVDFPTSLHDNAGVIGFVDGHSEVHKWLESSTRPTAFNRHPIYTSSEDRDVKWLQDHCSARK